MPQYPLLATGQQAVFTVSAIADVKVHSGAPGSAYVAGDVHAVSGGSGGTVTVEEVDNNGAVLKVAIDAPGSGYSSGTNVATTGGGGIFRAIAHAAALGAGYVQGDIVTVVQGGGSGGELEVTSVDGGGAVTGLALVSGNQGSGYATATALSTTGGTGTGLEVDITSGSGLKLDVTAGAASLPTLSPGPGDGIEVILEALKANAASIFYGPAGVTDATGAELAPGASAKFRISNLDLICVVAAAAGNSVSWAVTNI